jgi:DNA-binding GntR family transcriptional regulator
MPAESLASDAYRRMKEDIITCSLPPGSFHTEAELATRYGVSKTPVRFSLTLLQSEGLVTILPRRGIHIAPVNVQELQAVYTLRGLLEPFAASLAATNRKDEDLAELRRLWNAVHGDGKSDLAVDQIRAHSQFHVYLAKASGMRQLWVLIRTLHESMDRFLNSIPQIGRQMHFGDLDAKLLQAVEDGDATSAEALTREAIAASAELATNSIMGTIRAASTRAHSVGASGSS